MKYFNKTEATCISYSIEVAPTIIGINLHYGNAL